MDDELRGAILAFITQHNIMHSAEGYTTNDLIQFVDCLLTPHGDGLDAACARMRPYWDAIMRRYASDQPQRPIPDTGDTHTRYTVRLDQLILIDVTHAAYAGDRAYYRAQLADACCWERKRLVHRAYRWAQRCKACGYPFSVACGEIIQRFHYPVLPT